ncbi:MAG: phosphate ABC transporter, permease protein PstA [Desulfobulbaceae bacterium]|jgi:phosphate transport system permease protein|nr:MAG: phosphate ABC transporter, permease protein PstA [Desulfobulbaceae bacterium]HKJ15634.1 phosphate ABC transporter permease PstA [Desulfobulbales bacterium]
MNNSNVKESHEAEPQDSRTIDIVNRGLAKRYGKEQRFKIYGLLAVLTSLSFLALLFFTIFSNGYSAFFQTFVKLEVFFDSAFIDKDDPANSNFPGLVKKTLRNEFPEVKNRKEKKELYSLISSGAAFQLQKMIQQQPDLVGRTITIQVPADDDVDMLIKGNITRDVPESNRRLNDRQLAWIDKWAHEGKITKRFNTAFFTSGDSREPELAGILGALVGSILTLTLTLLLSFPVGVASAVYLEEFAPKNRWIDIVEVNINNLAAVPSIVFGLLGLAVFINFFHMPRSAPLVGGLVLTLMTLPVIIIASRVSLQSVPPSIREAALGIGASKMQTVLHHVLPLALPGMLTGTIIGIARALGETAPLLMIGMVAFIVDIPSGFTDPATALPVQIFLWADSPERGFVERTSAAIIVLLALLVVINSLAVILRNRFERRW